MSDKDPLLAPRGRRRRRLPPLVSLGLGLAGIGGIAALWIWVFSPIFVTPQEFQQQQRAFERALREVLHTRGDGQVTRLPPWPAELGGDRLRVLACVEAEVVKAVRHAPQWREIPFPWGDVPEHLGTSADLVVRCLRALNLDLQQLVAVDRKAEPKRYPLQLLQRRHPDRSLDHRRVSFQYAFAKAFMPEGPLELDSAEQMTAFQPGDIVFWAHGGREGHPGLVGLVLDRRDESGMPLAATLMPEEGRASGAHRLDEWPLIGHFELDIDRTLERFLETYPGTSIQPRQSNQ
jgi:uncharacterized protein